MCNYENINKVLKITELIAQNERIDMTDERDQRVLLLKLFGSEFSFGNIHLRLTALDAIYSANAGFNHFVIEDIAEKIVSFKSDKALIDYAKKIIDGEKDTKNLFNARYGITKNLGQGGKNLSLLSKYTHYVFKANDKEDFVGFPIYDSIVNTMYPKLYSVLYNKKDISTNDITNYVAKLNTVRKELFANKEYIGGWQQFDILDAYLWRMGKLSNGNFSQFLGKEDYIQLIKNLNLNIDKLEKPTEYNQRLYEIYKDNKNFEGCVKQKPVKNNRIIYSVDTDEIIRYKLSDSRIKAEQIFKGLKSEEYMTALLNHWREFYNNKINKKGQ